MASRVDSLQDIFGPNDPKSEEAETQPETTGVSSPNNNLDDFDDIFGGNTDAATTPPAAVGIVSSETQESPSSSPSLGNLSAALDADDFDNIFGVAPPAAGNQTTSKGNPPEKRPDGAKETESSLTTTSAASDGTGPHGEDETGGGSMEEIGSAATAGGGTVRDDKEFLDFLYEDNGDKKSDAAGTATTTNNIINSVVPVVPDVADSSSTAPTVSTNCDALPISDATEGSSSPLGEEASFLEKPVASSPGRGTPLGALGPIPRLGAFPLTAPSPSSSRISSTGARIPVVPGNEDREKEQQNVSPAAVGGPSLTPIVAPRKERMLRPLPDNPARALRDLVTPPPKCPSPEEKESSIGAGVEAGEGAADDVGYVRRLCAATGGFLPHDLRPLVWSLLLGLGREPNDSVFEKWREERRVDPSLVSSHSASTVTYKIDLRNDCLALARRLCETETETETETVESGGGGAGGEGMGGVGKAGAEALAIDIEEVLTFYCTRRSEAYEPVLCALVGPLFSMGLRPSAVSAMLYPLVGSLTLFLGRGLTHPVRDLAWGHAHRRLHDLCTYHDPQLVQHLDRCFPGWEMPLPAASVSRAETSALDQEAAAMVDDLESSLLASLPPRRSLSGKGISVEAVDGGDGGGGEEGRSGRGEGQGLVEPSLLVAANAGLGASVSHKRLLPLWDYLLVRHDKHFGFFLLLGSLLRRREELLAATGPRLRLLLKETLSPAHMATLLGAEDGAKAEEDKEEEKREGLGENLALSLWCEEAEALDLSTPESFRHHLALIGEIAEAEHEAAVREHGQKRPDGAANDGAAPAKAPAITPGGVGVSSIGGISSTVSGEQQVGKETPADELPPDGKGLGHPSLMRMRFLMKNAGDKLAADLKSLKLARSSSSGLRNNSDEPPPPTELSLPQLCLAVSAKELVTGISRKGRASSAGDGDAGVGQEEAVARRGGKGDLFRERRPLSFFAVDCRPKNQVDAGRFPTAYHLDPSSMDNPEEIAEKIMSVFEPLRRRAHVCLVGSGDGHLRARGVGRGAQDARWQKRNTGGKGGHEGGLVGSQKAARDEYSYVNTCALFFVKRGFPYVSVLEGGFAAAHELLMDTIDREDKADDNDDTVSASSGAIVDHNPAACRLCLHRKPTAGGGTGSFSSSGGSMGISVSGMLFPLSPPLWTLMGAADESTHGDAILVGKGISLDEGSKVNGVSGNGDGSSSGGGGGGEEERSLSPFFPSHVSPDGDTEKASSNESNASKASTTSRGEGGRAEGEAKSLEREEPGPGVGSGVIGGSGVSIGNGVGSSNGFGASNGVGVGVSSASNLFNKGGAIFSGMNMNMNMGGMFSRGGSVGGAGPESDNAKGGGDPSGGDQETAQTGKGGEAAGNIATKFRMSFVRFGSSKEATKGAGGERQERKASVADVAATAGVSVPKKESGIGSLFRKAQSLKAADVAAVFADLREGPKVSGSSASATSVSTPLGGVHSVKGARGQVVEVEEIVTSREGSDEDEDEDEDDGVFVIGDDGSEASEMSETPDSDFEGFDGEHKPPSAGGARSAADKEVALLEHRLSGQVKGATMVVDDFLKVPGAKVFTVTKHKVTFHVVDPTPNPAPENAASIEHETHGEEKTKESTSAADSSSSKEERGVARGDEASTAQREGSTSASEEEVGATPKQQAFKRLRVRAVTELERVVFLTRERILVLACPGGAKSPGLVKSNHHLTELQRMTFMRRDPTLVTLHYLAPQGFVEEGKVEEEKAEEVRGAAAAVVVEISSTKRNVYRFDVNDKEAFIRIVRGALQRFQA